MSGQLGIADALGADLRKSGLESGEKLGLELAVEPVAGVVLGNVAADVRVEEDRIGDVIAVLAEAADGNVDIYSCAIVDYAEGNGARSAVLIADELLEVEEVYSLILGRFAAEGESLSEIFKGLDKALAEASGEYGGLGAGVVDELARLGADVDDLALIDDDHALSVGNGDNGAVGDYVVAPLRVGGAAGGPVVSLRHENVLRNSLTVKIFFPLVGKNAARGAECCRYKSHQYISPFKNVGGFLRLPYNYISNLL